MNEQNAEVTNNPDNLPDKVLEVKDPVPEKKNPPLVVQNITLTFANGRRGTFMGPALMTTEEFRNMRDINLSHVDVGEPFVVKTDSTVEESNA